MHAFDIAYVISGDDVRQRTNEKNSEEVEISNQPWSWYSIFVLHEA